MNIELLLIEPDCPCIAVCYVPAIRPPFEVDLEPYIAGGDLKVLISSTERGNECGWVWLSHLDKILVVEEMEALNIPLFNWMYIKKDQLIGGGFGYE